MSVTMLFQQERKWMKIWGRSGPAYNCREPNNTKFSYRRVFQSLIFVPAGTD